MQGLTGQLIRRFSVAVYIISQQGMSDAGQMHADLMGSAGLQRAFNVGKSLKALQNSDMGDGTLSVLFIDSHFFAIRRVTSNRLVDSNRILLQNTHTDGVRFSIDGMHL